MTRSVFLPANRALMSMNTRNGADRSRGLAALLLLACFAAHGCSDSSTPISVDMPLDPTHERLMKIGGAYTLFTTRHKQPPKSWDDLRPILAESENADRPWSSDRDGQPLVVCWGVDVLKPSARAKATPVLAYEKQGAGGNRYVLTTVRSVELMSEKEFREASFPPGHIPGF
jgi:hypothetical protein